jgi:hypothetical protein
MKHNRKFTTSLIFAVVMLLLPFHVHGQCSAATIQGNYGFGFSSFFDNRPGTLGQAIPNAQAGRISFTATSSTDGTLTGAQSGAVGGAPSDFTFTGTYSVGSDCTGTVTRTLANGDVQVLAIAIVQGGVEIEFAFHSTSFTPQTGQGVMKRQ